MQEDGVRRLEQIPGFNQACRHASGVGGLLALGLVLSLAGCASDAPPRKKVDSEAQDAAALQVQLGRGYMEQGDLETAMERLQRALQLDPRSVDANTMLGALNERIRRPTKAEAHYRQAVRLAPDNGEVNNNLGAFLCGSGRYQEADGYFLKALDDPFYRSVTAAMVNAGACALKAGDETKAEAYLRQVLEAQPSNVVALYELARMSYRRNDGLRARAFLQRLEASAPDDPSVLDLAQRIETRFGDADAARRHALRLQNEYPDYQPDPSLDGSNPP